MPTNPWAARIGALCALIVAIFHLSTIREGHEWGDDFSQYIRHASNLAQGLPYTASSYLYNADNPAVGPRVYPPGFPVLLAPVIRTFGLALRPMKIEIVLFFAAALFVIYLLIQPLMRPAAAAAVVLIVGLNPFFWDFKDQILSDIPFLFFFVATLLCLTRADEPDRRRRTRVMFALCGGAAMFAAYVTRVVGIVLLPSLVVRDLIRHRRLTREGLIAAATSAALAGVTYVIGPRDSSYTDLLTVTPAIVLDNIVSYLRWSSEIWENGYVDLARKGLFLVTTALAVVGCVSIRKQPHALLLAVVSVLYLAVVIVWPLAQGTRLLIPLIPFIVACAVLGALSIDRAVADYGGVRHAVVTTLCTAVVVTYVARYTTVPFGRVPEGIGKRESVELFDFVKTATRPDDVIVFSRPRALALLTERTVTPPPRNDDACRLWAYIQRVRAGYIATGPGNANNEAMFLARFVRDYAPNLRELMRNADVGVYRVERAAVDCVDRRHAVR